MFFGDNDSWIWIVVIALVLLLVFALQEDDHEDCHHGHMQTPNFM